MTLLTTLANRPTKAGQSLLDQNFDSTTIGNIPTGWTVDSGINWQVVPNVAGFEGTTGRVLEVTTDTSFDHYLRPPPFTRITSGLIEVGWEVKTPPATDSRGGIVQVYDTTGIYACAVGPFSNGQWLYGNGSGLSATAGTWAASTVYEVRVIVDMDQKKFKFSIRPKGGATTVHDNAGAWWALTTGQTGVDRLVLSAYSVVSRLAYINDLQVGQIVPSSFPPTAAGSVTTSGPFGGEVMGSDMYGQIKIGYTNSDPLISNIRLERSSDNVNWADVSATARVVQTGAGQWIVSDRRPHFGDQSTTFGSTVYYRVSGFNSGGSTPVSDTGAMVHSLNIPVLELSRLADLVDYMDGAAVPASVSGDAYPNFWLHAMVYGYVKYSDPTYLTLAQAQFDYMQSLTHGTAGIMQLPDYTDWFYRDHHWRAIQSVVVCARLLRLMGDTAADALAAEMITQADAWADAFYTNMNSGAPLTSVTRGGWDGGDASLSNNQRVWAGLTGYRVGDIVTPTVRNGRTYRVTVAGATGASQPTWPTTNGGIVTNGSVTFQETGVTGSTSFSVYSTTPPYTGLAGENLVDLNQNLEECTAMALLLSDPDSMYYAPGADRATAISHVTETTRLVSTYATSTGAVPIGDTYPAINGPEGYDVLYGAYALELIGLTLRFCPAGIVNPWLDHFLVRGTNWLATSYGSEPLTTMHYSGSTDVTYEEITLREAAHNAALVQNPVEMLRYTSAFNDTINNIHGTYNQYGAVSAPALPAHNSRFFANDPFLELLRQLRALLPQYIYPSQPLRANSFDMGTDGVTLTSGNTGSANSNAFDSITGSPTFSSNQKFPGGLSMRVSNPAVVTSANWTALGTLTGSVYFRFHLWLDQLPATNRLYAIRILNAAGATCGYLRIMPDGKISPADASNSGFGQDSASSIPTGQWVRIEVRIQPSTSAGQFEWRLFTNPMSEVATETKLGTGLVLTANVGQIHMGATLSPYPTGTFNAYFDQPAISTIDWLGPVSWEAIESDPSNISFVVMNDASGHATSSNSDYAAEVSQARAAGLKVLAYIETSYGGELMSQVQTEMQRHRDWYDVDGFFLDEAASDLTNLAYYQEIRAWVNLNMPIGKRTIVLNHGTMPDEGYMTAGDILITFEGSAASYTAAALP
jgi:hypothetical protein